jgi:UDP-N-acetylglucosamine/UDP-N-acetylgalactosamine 4-epimerase
MKPSGSSPAYEHACQALVDQPRTWLVTGAAGFIGSNLVERLLGLGQRVVAIDNFATGSRRNIEKLEDAARESRGRFSFTEADIRSPEACRRACADVDVVLHQAALGSVPRSVTDPISTNAANIDGFLNMLVAARDAGVKRFLYAASSSTYGDHPGLPKVEERIGRPLSPYAVTKYVNELYASVFQRTYGLEVIGFRYFNVFGRRQDPDGPYAAVIPRWISTLLNGGQCEIYGDGESSRDFCYVENVVQLNVLGALADPSATGEVYNAAVGGRTTLNALYHAIRNGLAARFPEIAGREPVYQEFRAGDIRHSQADISKARERLGYEPTHDFHSGLAESLCWYLEDRSTTDHRR